MTSSSGAMASGYGEAEGVYRSADWIDLPQHPHQSFTRFLFSGPVGYSSNASKPLLIDSETEFTITCSDFHRYVCSLGSALSSVVGVRQGDVVLILLSNTVYFPVIFHAILSIGAVATTANPASTEADIRRQFRDAGAKFLVTMPELMSKLGDLGTRVPTVLLSSSSVSPSPNLFLLETLLRSGPRASASSDTLRIRASDPAAILYSSGTTGPSKGVVLSHGNFIAAVSLAAPGSETLEDTGMILVPLFHVAGLMFLGCLKIRMAGTLIVLPKFDFLRMLECIQRYRVTALTLVPPIVIALTKHPAVDKFDLSSVKSAGSGAAPLAKETLETFLRKFPHIEKFTAGYGMTETTAVGTGGTEVPGSVGKLAPNHEAKVVDLETGECVPPYKTGELWLRGPCIMQGYLNNPTATAATIDNEGWLHTGDVVYVDSSGHFFVVDRLKELIKYKGFQVAPAELEALLLTHPAIADVAVIPYPDDDAGEIPLACVVSGAGMSISDKDVMSFVERQVAPHKKVRRVVFLKEIPKSASGKILRKDLVALTRSSSKL